MRTAAASVRSEAAITQSKSVLRRLAEQLTRVCTSGTATGRKEAPAAAAGDSFGDLTVVSTGWVTRRDRRQVAELDADAVAVACKLLRTHGPSFRASLMGLWQVVLRWQQLDEETVLAEILVDNQLASLNLLWAAGTTDSCRDASELFGRRVGESLNRRFEMPDNLGEPPLIVTMRWPFTANPVGEHDIEAARLNLAAAYFRNAALPEPPLPESQRLPNA